MITPVSKKTFLLIAIIAFSVSLFVCITGFLPDNKKVQGKTYAVDSVINVPMGGNAWRNGTDTTGGNIGNDGIVNWTDPDVGFTAYVRFGHTGKFKLYLELAVPDGESKIRVSALGKHRSLNVSRSAFKDYYAGEWTVRDTGYVAFKINAISKTGNVFAAIRSIKLSGTAVDERTSYVKDNDGQFFYWGRRGPSVHLSYNIPEGVNAEWFYNEVTVPVGNDIIGSYFMADGFAEGYFGMQVNGPRERHILFSVWSPFNTDDPKAIPDDQKIILLKKGENVHAGEFGNEGSGGQSYLNYLWKAGITYKFLVHAKPTGNGRTEYTAYFYAPESNKWQLIASFSRPKTNTYLKHLHSFLENFEPVEGIRTREVLFNNQWVRSTNGEWTELSDARFTGDNTAIKGYRMDYAGGLEGGAFYLKNCGFFDQYTPRNLFFERPKTNKKPNIDLSKLP
jgi:hypothetical protein